MTDKRVLAVDDEEINLEIIDEALSDSDYTVDRALDGEQAWQLLSSAGKEYDLVILDRMMPGLDGIGLLRRLKADDRLRHLPVIMQTAAAAPAQVREGIEAGAYYYLTKPYEPRALLAIIRAAFNEAAAHARAHEAESGLSALKLAHNGEFRLRDLDEARALAIFLGRLCPDPTTAAMGLAELMINAVEHGNLEISYEEKRNLRLDDTWEHEVARRLQAPQWRDRIVQVRFERDHSGIRFVVIDAGRGFDAARFLDFDPERACDPNGRGIALARKLCFNELEFQGTGNVAVAHVRIP